MAATPGPGTGLKQVTFESIDASTRAIEKPLQRLAERARWFGCRMSAAATIRRLNLRTSNACRDCNSYTDGVGGSAPRQASPRTSKCKGLGNDLSLDLQKDLP
jgi:hypothetical protein